MQCLPDITPTRPSRVTWLRCADADLAADLDHAEFAERRAALQPRGYVRSIDHILSAANNDTDAAAYLAAWEAIKEAHKPPRLDDSHPRRQLAAARHRFDYLRRMPDRSRGLRSLMDYHFHMMMAFADLASLERQAKRLTAAKREAKEAARRETFGALGLAC